MYQLGLDPKDPKADFLATIFQQSIRSTSSSSSSAEGSRCHRTRSEDAAGTGLPAPRSGLRKVGAKGSCKRKE